MQTLLLMELRSVGGFPIGPDDTTTSSSPDLNASCPSLEFLLSENLLEKLYSWSLVTGRFVQFLLPYPVYCFITCCVLCDLVPHPPLLFEWKCVHLLCRYSTAVRLQQLKLYELLVSRSRHQLLSHEPFLRPLLQLLASSAGEVFPLEVEKKLVVLLNQLCISLMENVQLLDLFFFTSSNGKTE